MRDKSIYHDNLMLLAMELAERSYCVKQKVGAVLAKDTRILATGYNGPPIGTYRCNEIWPITGCTRSIRGGCTLSIHAEQSAIFKALKEHIDLTGSTLYVTLSPCLPCARIIFGAGITKVVYKDSYAAYKRLPIEEGLHFLYTYSITVEKYDPNY